MKTDARKPSELHYVNGHSLGTPVTFQKNAVRSMKRICYLFVFTGIAALFNSCAAGWVATEPSYGIEIERPARPGDGYIWIEGGWKWDYGRHSYVREPGYWVRPRPNHSYINGYWQSGPRGKSWVRGHWERENNRNDNHGRGRDRDRDRDHNR